MSEPCLAATVATPMIVRSSLLLLALVACGESPNDTAADEVAPRVGDLSDRAARFVVSVAVQEQNFDLCGSAMMSTDADADAADASPVWEYDYYQSCLYVCGGQWFSAWVEIFPLSPGGPPGSYDIDLRLEHRASLSSQPNKTQQPTGAPSGAGG